MSFDCLPSSRRATLRSTASGAACLRCPMEALTTHFVAFIRSTRSSATRTVPIPIPLLGDLVAVSQRPRPRIRPHHSINGHLEEGMARPCMTATFFAQISVTRPWIPLYPAPSDDKAVPGTASGRHDQRRHVRGRDFWRLPSAHRTKLFQLLVTCWFRLRHDRRCTP